MTQFGKILICVNLVFSVLLAAWALGVYTNRVDWANQKASAEQPTEIKKRQARVDEAQKARAWAEPRLRDNYNFLLATENQRRTNAVWYDQQIQSLRNGQGNMKTIDYQMGKFVLDRAGLPQMSEFKTSAGQPLQA